MINWVTVAKFAAESGYSEQAIRKKVNDRKWPDAVWHKAPDGHILINIAEYERWVESDPSTVPPVVRQSKHRAGLKNKRPESASLGSPRLPTI
jgi:hypothetical protein